MSDEEARPSAGGSDVFLHRAARCSAPFQAFEALANLCVPPDPRYDEPPDPEIEEMLRDADELKEKLHVLFSTDMRREVIAFIRDLNENREAYRKTLLLWFDLVEGLAFEVELAYGDNTGPVKLKRVRAAVFYLMSKFSGGLVVPGVPHYLNRLFLHIAVRGTVEYIITLVNAEKIDQRTAAAGAVYNHGLWNRDLPRARAEMRAVGRRSLLRRAQDTAGRLDEGMKVRAARWWEPVRERFVNWLLDKLLAPPAVSEDFKRKVDALVADMTAGHPNVPPIDRAVHRFFKVVRWIGQHGKEIRAAIDVFSIAINWTARVGEMSRERRIEVVTEALIRYFDDLGMRGPFFRFVLRLVVDINLDAIHFLYVKRRVIRPADDFAAQP